MNNREAVNWLINILADIGKAEHSDLWHYEQELTEIKDMLESAQPEKAQLSQQGTEPHEGYWIDKGIFTNGLGISWHCCECSKCHSQKTSTSNYCPNCGAKMKGERKE